jgi:beta-glucosidase
MAFLATAQEKPRFLDTSKPVDDRVKDFISRLTLEQKGDALNHRGKTIEVAGFQLREDHWNQCLNGVQWRGEGSGATTLFPICLGMAATFDTQLVHQVATAISDEARAIYNRWHLDPSATGERKGLIYRAPVINIGRNPYWGRNYEAWGEDPYLVARMGVAYVKGLQGDDPKYLKLAATLKHYAVNNVEQDRKKLDMTVSERMMHEYWLPHFKACVMEGKAQSLMASYNALNGIPNNMNPWLLTDVLKQQWKHEGFVVSDLGGVKTMIEGHKEKKMTYLDAVSQSIMAGCDFSDKEYAANIPEAIRTGKLTESRLNDALSRVLRTRMRLGEFDPFDAVPYSKIPMSVVCSAEHRALALKTAQKAIVLLENKNHMLPLDKNQIKKIVVIGPLSKVIQTSNYTGNFTNAVDLLTGIQNRAGMDKVTYVKTQEVEQATSVIQAADVVIVAVGTTRKNEDEGRDRNQLTLPAGQEELIKQMLALNPKTIIVQSAAGPVTAPWLKAHAPAWLQSWWFGEESGNAVADVIFGTVNPAGRLPHTVYASPEQVPSQSEYDISKGFTYMYVKGEPQYAFGYGLSYTTFAYSNVKVEGTDPFTVSVDITNTGKVAGDEVPQLYFRQMKPRVVRPSKELRGFARITLKPGEKETVSFTLSPEKLAFYDEAKHAFVTDPGAYELMLGASSADIRLKTVIDAQ